MKFDRHVRGCRVEPGGVDVADRSPRRQVRDVLRHVRPRLAAIACQLEVTVIRPRPNDVRILG